MKNILIAFTIFIGLANCCNSTFASEEKAVISADLVEYGYTKTFGGQTQIQDLENYLQTFPSYKRCSLCREDIFTQTLKMTLKQTEDIGREESIYSCELIDDKQNLTTPELSQYKKLSFFRSAGQLHHFIYPHTKHFPSELPVIMLFYGKENVSPKFLALHIHHRIILDGKTILPQSEIEPEPITLPPSIITPQPDKQQPKQQQSAPSTPTQKHIKAAAILKATGLVVISAAVVAIICNFDKLQTYFSQVMSKLWQSLSAQK